MDVLVIDIGGSHVKLCESRDSRVARFNSDRSLTPQRLVTEVQAIAHDWHFDVISVGYPGAAGPGGPRRDAPKLGPGWVGFDFSAALGRPVRVVNDAAMQALGAYDGGRMLFLGLGTGLGSALVSERVLVPLELGGLASDDGQTLARRLGKAALEERGHDGWQRGIEHACAMLKNACDADYITLGGGNAAHVDPLPPSTRRGGNDDAFAGGVRLWEDWVEEHDVPRSNVWRVVW